MIFAVTEPIVMALVQRWHSRVIVFIAMIVKGLDRNTNEAMVRRSFEYITQFPIVDIRLVRDRFGNSKGFCFVQWKTLEVGVFFRTVNT